MTGPEVFEAIKWGAELTMAIVLAVAPVVLAMTKKGQVDLFKTLEAASDVAKIIGAKLREDDAPDFGALIENGVAEVEKIRGKVLSPKLKRKARARIEAVVKASQ